MLAAGAGREKGCSSRWSSAGPNSPTGLRAAFAGTGGYTERVALLRKECQPVGNAAGKPAG